MDVVYILGKGSVADDKELLYSLRSLEQNMKDLQKVFIVGECPKWVKKVEHIPADDPYEQKWRNAYHKTLKVCGVECLSHEFLLMNDDFFALEPFLGELTPFWAVKSGNGGSSGKNDFGIHAPIRIKKEWYQKLPLSLDLRGEFSPRSFYANFYNAPVTYTHDFILRGGEGMPEYDVQVVGWPWFSISNDQMLDKKFQEWIDYMYPQRSKYEI